MNISSYEDLLDAANKQAEQQRLLFVFTSAEMSGDQPNARKEGTLTPVMCFDKLARERGDFASLVEESIQTGMSWDIVFVACMSGKPGAAPSSKETEQPLKTMIKSIQDGNIGSYLAFNREGELIQLSLSMRNAVH